ncbi:MAG: hypothetical protein ACI9EW_004022 [Cellvibrionaceae bacterium]|jgi:hypothetical protein
MGIHKLSAYKDVPKRKVIFHEIKLLHFIILIARHNMKPRKVIPCRWMRGLFVARLEFPRKTPASWHATVKHQVIYGDCEINHHFLNTTNAIFE